MLNTTKQDTTKIITLLKIGDQYKYTNPDTALYFYQKAIKLAKEKKEQKFIAKTYNSIGIIYAYKILKSTIFLIRVRIRYTKDFQFTQNFIFKYILLYVFAQCII